MHSDDEVVPFSLSPAHGESIQDNVSRASSGTLRRRRGGFHSGVRSKLYATIIMSCGLPVISRRVDRILLPTLEFISLGLLSLFLTFGLRESSPTHEVASLSYVRSIIDPLAFASSLTSYSIIFTVAVSFVLFGLLVLIALVLLELSSPLSSFLCRLQVLYARLTRTILLLPLLSILLDPFRLDLGSSILRRLDSIPLTDFPILLYAIFGILGSVWIVAVSVVDALFYLDKFRVEVEMRELVTSTPDGIIQFVIVGLMILSVGIEVGVPVDYSVVSTSVISVLVFGVMVFMSRMTPYVSRAMSMGIGSMIGLAFGCSVASVTVSISKHVLGYLGILFLGLGPLLALMLALLRFCLLHHLMIRPIHSRQKKGRLPLNLTRTPISFLFVWSNASDLCVLLSHILPDTRVDCVLQILQDSSVRKTKRFAHMLAGLVLDHPALCASILSHSKSIRRRAWLHDTVALTFYSDKITHLRQTGQFHRNLRKIDDESGEEEEEKEEEETVSSLRVSRLLSELSHRERHLCRLYQFVLGQFLISLGSGTNQANDNGSGNGTTVTDFSGFGSAVSEISFHRSFCEKTYERLMESHATAEVLQRYGSFAQRFLNDLDLASRCRHEADSLRRLQRRTQHETSPSIRRRRRKRDPTPMSPTARTLKRSLSFHTISALPMTPMTPQMNRRLMTPLPPDEVEEEEHFERREVNWSSCSSALPHQSRFLSTTNSLSSSRILKSAVNDVRIWPAKCLQVSLVLFLVSLVLVFASTFALFFVAHSRFVQSAVTIEMASRARERVTRSPSYLFRYHLAFQNETVTPFPRERNTESIRDLAETACTELKELGTRAYHDMETIQDQWRNPSLTDFADDQHNHSISLIDSMLGIAGRCLVELEEQDAVFASESYVTREDFVSVVKSEELVQSALLRVIQSFLSSEREYGVRQRSLILGISMSPLLFLPLFLIGYFWYSFEYCRSFRALSLVRRDHLFTLYRRFKGKVSNLGNERIILQKMSSIQCFLLLIIPLVILPVLLGTSIFSITSWIAVDSFNAQNRIFLHSCRLKTDVHRIHFLSKLALYPEKSPLSIESVRTALHNEADQMKHKFMTLRFGSSEEELTATDQDPVMNSLFYESICDPSTNLSALPHREYLECQPLVRQVSLLALAARKLADPSIDPVEMRKSEEFQTIIEMDNDLEHGGVIQRSVRDVRTASNDAFTEEMGHFLGIAYLVVIIICPVFVITTFVSLWRLALTLDDDLRQIRNLICLLPVRVIYQDKTLFHFLTGRSKSFKSLMRSRHRESQSLFLGILEKSDSGLLWFDKKGAILAHNIKASDLLSRVRIGSTINELFTPDSIDQMTRWMQQPYRSSYAPFSGEIDAVYDENEVLAIRMNVTRDRDTFLAHLEDVESAKKKKILEEREKRSEETEELLRNILPESIADRIRLKEKDIFSTHKSCTCWFTDICDFTGWSSVRQSEEIVRVLHDFFSMIDRICKRNNLEKIKTIGDGYFAVCGVPRYRPTHAKIAMENAIEVWHAVKEFNERRGLTFLLRMGLASGSVTAGVIGEWKFCYDLWGAAVNAAARAEAHCPVDKIMVSRSTYENVFDVFSFVERKIDMQGLGRVTCYVHSPAGSEVMADEFVDDLDDSDLVEVEEEEGEGVLMNETDQIGLNSVMMTIETGKGRK